MKNNFVSNHMSFYLMYRNIYRNLSDHLKQTILNDMALFGFLQNDIAFGPSKFWEDHSLVGLGWKT